MKYPPFTYILMKLASKCNINCSYCYWFRDESVYSKPALLTIDVENMFLQRLVEHMNSHKLLRFSILFHGGEPMLFGKQRFFDLCKKIRQIEQNLGVEIVLSMTTNGLMIDEEWTSIFKYYKVSITISIDGNKEIHDLRRVDFKGLGTYDKVIEGITLLKKFGISPGILSVCSPNSDPKSIFNHFIKELKLYHFDILIPDATFEDANIPSIANFYKELFDIWYSIPNRDRIEIRTINSLILGLLGFNTTSEGLGYGPIVTSTLLTDGSIEPLDVLRIAGKSSTHSNINIFDNSLQDVTQSQIWKEAYYFSLNLNKKCYDCKFVKACGGGYLPHRWSKANRYDNVNVYCEDLKEIFTHVADRLLEEIVVVDGNSEAKLTTIIK